MIFLTCMHGNEYLPAISLADHGISQIIANPRAVAQNKRYTETDLNKSFGKKGNSYEEKRARELLRLISSNEVVIDFHTTSADTDPFAIVVDESMIETALMTGLKKVVVMKHNIKNGHALINYRKGISVECGLHNSTSSYKTAISIVNNLKTGKAHKAIIYEVYDKITEPGEYKNFQKYNNEFFPVLAGSKAYDFIGLKAKTIKTL